MNQPSFDPNRNLGSLVVEISRLMHRNFNRRARKLGLTQTQWQAIACLRRHEGINQAALAELLEIQPISAARLLDRLEASGWIERRRDPRDRRAVQLFITPKTQPVLSELRTAAEQAHAEAVAGLPEAECELVLQVLARIKANLTNAEFPSEQAAAGGK